MHGSIHDFRMPSLLSTAHLTLRFLPSYFPRFLLQGDFCQTRFLACRNKLGDGADGDGVRPLKAPYRRLYCREDVGKPLGFMEELGSKPLSGAMAEQVGPEAELEQVVWQPYSRAVVFRSPVGLEVKLGALVLLLLVTLLCGFLPLWVFHRPGTATSLSGTRKKALSLVSCFAGGVFLGTCLLDLIPDYLSSISKALADLGVTLFFPLQEFILAMGFFLVLVMEQIVLAYKDPSGSLEETQSLLGSASYNSATIQDRDWPDGPLPRQLPREGRLREPPHFHVDFNSHSVIRCFVLLLALSLHSIFEGLAVGLQEGSAQALEICLALLIHKGAIAFSLSFKLLQSRLRSRAVAGCLVLFSVMTPLGIGLGIALTEAPVAILHGLSRSVLEGLAAGTFVYITFLEILPHELSSSEQRILKVIVLLAGFALVTSILFIKI
uniref:zinc transporter ZIP1 n=1 Tax=Euleptes europaea TaxID=460621 RepID=UPI0025402D77|nr:zinc transporter ZIP1 [Euleptes europaea]